MDLIVPQPAQTSAQTGCPRRVFRFIFAATLLISCALLFTRLGHYALWDDEARDALCAQSVLLTGDTKAFVGHNIIGYDDGALLFHLRCEGIPPFVAYTSALSMKVFGVNAFAARFPLALFGLACVALMFYWMRKMRAPAVTVAVFSIALITNVSFFLYSRQCHYYSATMFFSVAIGYAYVNWRGAISQKCAMALCLALLIPATPLFFIAACLCLLVDYLLWQRKIRPVGFRDMALVLAPSFFVGLAMVRWWNPLHCTVVHWLGHNTLFDRLTIFLWFWRDMNHCEMAPLLLLPFAVVAAFASHNTLLKRGLTAIVVFVLAMTFLTTQSVSATSCADIRFLSMLLPLFIAIEAYSLCWLVKASTERAWPAIPVAVAVFGTNLIYGGGLFLPEGVRSTICCFVQELWNPPSDPYTETAKWIRENVRPGESIWVQPHPAEGPLMFHAPDPLYAWQLPMPPKGQYAKLPLIHFRGGTPPDYMLAFGPHVAVIRQEISKLSESDREFCYQPQAVVNCFWKDAYRPELFWRSFVPIRDYDPALEAIYVYKRVKRSAAQ